jgi:hypothetical protein
MDATDSNPAETRDAGIPGLPAAGVELAAKYINGSWNGEKRANFSGTHAGNLLADAIVMTCWATAEAEHRLRHKLLDLLQEIAESAGG